jgi:aspartyl-tRNA(Asn)/glutamyl-tRNA(Gln) amidotransferase subunit B
MTTITSDAGTDWEIVCGLEVHCELSTATKLFCGCANEFGAEPNTHVCAVCLGLPGSLPVLNERAVEYALRVGEAFGFDVPPQSIFHRKNYFYPDMPKNFQTTQYDEPICAHGSLAVDGSVVGITRAHLEEDTGKSTHIGGTGGRIHGASHSLVDYNRAGVPLLEIVSEPDLRSAEQAAAYVDELRSTLKAIGVSDVKMEEGSLRVDANVSVRPVGTSEFGTRCEIKNLNSLKSLRDAIDYEARRQVDLLEAGDKVVQETRLWNENAGHTASMRSKEEAYDYRYFPEPDLVPIAPTDELRAMVRSSMPELPSARRARLIDEWGIGEAEARTLVDVDALADYAEAVKAVAPAAVSGREIANWATQDVLGVVNAHAIAVHLLDPSSLAELLGLLDDGSLSRNQAKDVLAEMLVDAKRPADIVAERGIAQVNDTGALEKVLDEVFATNADAVAEWRAGDDKVRKKKRGFLMGEAMKALKGQGNPKLLNELLDSKLAE